MINKDDLKRVIELNTNIKEKIEPIVRKDFREFYDENVSIIQKIYLRLEDEFTIIKYPINSKELGGFIYKTENHSFCFINSNQVRIFQNFVLMHEYYHLTHENFKKNQVDPILSNEEDSIDLRERKANYYASLMILTSLRENYNSFVKDKNFTFEKAICYLIDLYKVPKKTILIRLHELGCIGFETLYSNFYNDIDNLKKQFKIFGLDTSILEKSSVIKLDNMEDEFKKAKETGAMLETFLEQNESYYKELLEKLRNNKNV